MSGTASAVLCCKHAPRCQCSRHSADIKTEQEVSLTCLSVCISALHGCSHAVDGLPGGPNGSAKAFDDRHRHIERRSLRRSQRFAVICLIRPDRKSVDAVYCGVQQT